MMASKLNMPKSATLSLRCRVLSSKTICRTGVIKAGSRCMCILHRETLLHPAQNLATGRIIPEPSHTLNSRQGCLDTAILVCSSWEYSQT